ncbi:MAG: acetyl-CoA carboxylase carboxyltransferase subunit alpha [Acidobacteria bacterium]|nr:acetyl-CoA carboxylase carboxyltransferase subunit alpha [Acidobacteriota bacterium]MCA1637612.1 acetyl-CoA carboxylase carboxyltransferase subunit alpha [Acidobacteriota bacterium]
MDFIVKAFQKRKLMKNNRKDAFERIQTARHSERPYTLDLLDTIFSNFVEIHGDRRYGDDPAIICGFARLDGYEVAIVGQQKGRDTNQRRFRNFGMPKPEGYRKALRVMKLAEKFKRPIITFIDTPGAYPGIDAEERGQAEAIAFNLREMSQLKVPVIVVILGEGGSGGALAIGVGDKILMLENAVYSVITPEGCAAILWKDAEKANLAAESLRLTATDLMALGLIDEIVPELVEWHYAKNEKSHSKEAFEYTAAELRNALLKDLKILDELDERKMLETRFRKFRKMGEWI